MRCVVGPPVSGGFVISNTFNTPSTVPKNETEKTQKEKIPLLSRSWTPYGSPPQSRHISALQISPACSKCCVKKPLTRTVVPARHWVIKITRGSKVPGRQDKYLFPILFFRCTPLKSLSGANPPTPCKLLLCTYVQICSAARGYRGILDFDLAVAPAPMHDVSQNLPFLAPYMYHSGYVLILVTRLLQVHWTVKYTPS